MPQYIPAPVSPFHAAADEFRKALAERIMLQRQEELETYKRQQDALKYGLEERRVKADEEQVALSGLPRQTVRGLITAVGPDGKPTRAYDEPGVTPYMEPKQPPAERAIEPLERVIGPDGKPKLVPRSQAAGATPYEPQPSPREPRVAMHMMTGPDGKDVLVRVNLDTGVATPVETGGLQPRQTQKPPTGAERQAVAFYKRAKEADETAQTVEDQIAGMGKMGQLAVDWLPNIMQSQVGQTYRQAQRAFTEARLRKESGAAVPQSEYDNDARTYWAVAGDSPETVKQKRGARKSVLDGLKFSAGKAFEEFYGPQQDKPKRRVFTRDAKGRLVAQ